MNVNSLHKSPAPGLDRLPLYERGATHPVSAEDVAPTRDDAGRACCPFCFEPLQPNLKLCPRCLRAFSEKTNVAPEATTAKPAAPPLGTTQIGAVYTLESPTRCPQCEKEIRTLRVLRILRTQVSFTSTLPRKGYVVICPECERLLSAELSGLV